MIDTDGSGGATIDVPHPVEIPPSSDPLGIPVPHDVPAPDSPLPRGSAMAVNDPAADLGDGPRGDPLMP